MELLDLMAQGGHDRLIAVQDRNSGLRGWIALHNTSRGPAYGGIRVWRYRNESEAMMDALRLSRAMTWKCTLAGVAGGGAKTVVLADRIEDRQAAMLRLGEIIEDLGGIYRCGPDAGFVESDALALSSATQHLAHHQGGLRPSGEATSEGILWSMKAALAHIEGRNDLKGCKVAIQGLGAVGLPLAKSLVAEGCTVIGADTNTETAIRAQECGVQLVDPATIYEVEADIFTPCALGGVLHDLSIQRLRSKLVIGGANNTLARSEHADLLAQRGITYIPDFVVNAGALIEGVGHEQTGQTDFSVEIKNIGNTVKNILAIAENDGATPRDAALRLARAVLGNEEMHTSQMEEQE